MNPEFPLPQRALHDRLPLRRTNHHHILRQKHSAFPHFEHDCLWVFSGRQLTKIWHQRWRHPLLGARLDSSLQGPKAGEDGGWEEEGEKEEEEKEEGRKVRR